ncbi:MAG: ATP-grasp domain-containing protein [Clostridiales bacterium]|nr:ATP-grasp domain-containing protein [Clostridiales bacterium]
MKVCNTRYELEEELNSIAAETDLDLLVEENIQIKREISLLGISCSGNAFCAGGFIPEISGNDSRRGVSAKGKMISHKASDEIFEKIKPIFVAMNYTGLFGVDLLESKNGEIFFIEINFRYGASGYTITKNGVNLPQMMVSYMKDGKMPCDELIKTDKCCGFVSEKVLLEEYEEGFIDAKTVKRIIEDAEILFVKDDKDEKPFRQLMKNYKELI